MNRLFFILILCCIGCNYKTNQSAKVLKLKDTFTVNRDLDVGNLNYMTNKSERHFNIFYPSLGKFLRYNLSTNSFDDSLIIPALKQGKFFFSLSDSFACILPYDSSSILVYPKFNNQPPKVYSSESTNTLASLCMMMEVSADKTVFLLSIPNLQIGNKDERLQYFSSRLISHNSMPAQQDKIVEDYAVGTFPASYRSNLFMEFYPITAKINDSEIAYVFSKDENIFIAKGAKVDSNKIIGLPPAHLDAANQDSIYYQSYTSTYQLNQDFFIKLLYDSVNNYFFLFRVKQPLVNKEGLLSLWEDKELVVYAIDASKHTVVAEKSLGICGDYELAASFCYDGLLYLPKLKNNRLHFEKYAIGQ